MEKRTSKRWSMKDIKFIQKCIKEAKDAGAEDPRTDGIKAAAEHFGVSFNACYNRLHTFEQGKCLGGLKKNTTKIPIKERIKYKKQAVKPNLDRGNILTFIIKDVQIDLDNRLLTIIY